MKYKEIDFKNRLIPDLEKEGLNVLDLKSSVLDMFIDSGKRCFVELKVANRHYKAYSNDKGINLTIQTNIIKKMDNLPIVIACDQEDMDRCYLILPEKLKRFTDEKLHKASKKGKLQKILIGTHHLKDCTFSYSEMITKVKNYIC